MPEYVVAVEAGLDTTRAAAIDLEGTIVARLALPAVTGDFEATVAQAVSAIFDLSMKVDGDVAAAGLSIPGPYHDARGYASAPELWGEGEFALQDVLRMHVSLPVFVETDRFAHVLGEQWLGIAYGKRDLVCLWSAPRRSTAGILAGGRLLRGAHDRAGVIDSSHVAELAQWIRWLDPEMVVVGGESDRFDELRAALGNPVRVERSLLGEDAAMVGMARLALGDSL